MKQVKEMILQIIKGMSRAGIRFPLTVVSLIGAAGIICYTVFRDETPELLIQKVLFTLIVAAFIGMTAQFACERFPKLAAARAGVYGAGTLLAAGYFLILWPAPEITAEAGIRTFVAVFALLCAVLWIPSYKGKTNFNIIALIHVKSMFTSFLYSGVLSAGISAIIFSVDILLFSVNSDAYAYTMTLIWVLFATIYYLSLLPKFGSTKSDDIQMMDRSDNFPRFLEILISYIAIPLITAYTLVLAAYFVKILVTTNWPSGQVGMMVLIYSAAGLLIFILSSLLENRFAVMYRLIFPKVLIPVVIMQLVSVWIRLEAYGVTESRYYVALFGVFSIAAGLLLSIKPTSKNGLIALLAACFALISIIPPVDAFTVSRESQIARVENLLAEEGILKDGKLSPKENAAEITRVETTNILTYLDNRSSLKYISWLPEDFNIYDDMKTTFGFESSYTNYPVEETNYFYASLDASKPLNISGYDLAMVLYSYRYSEDKGTPAYNFTLDGTEYTLATDRISKDEAVIRVTDSAGTELISTGLADFAEELADEGDLSKEALPPEKMTLETEQDGYKLKVIFQNISITYVDGPDAGIDYTAYVMFQAQ